MVYQEKLNVKYSQTPWWYNKLIDCFNYMNDYAIN